MYTSLNGSIYYIMITQKRKIRTNIWVWFLKFLGYFEVCEKHNKKTPFGKRSTKLEAREYNFSRIIAVFSIFSEMAFTVFSIIAAWGYVIPNNTPSFLWIAIIITRYLKKYLLTVYRYSCSTLYIVASDGRLVPGYGEATFKMEMKFHKYIFIALLASIALLFVMYLTGWMPTLDSLLFPVIFLSNIYIFLVGMLNILNIALPLIGFKSDYIEIKTGSLSQTGTYETKKAELVKYNYYQ